VFIKTWLKSDVAHSNSKSKFSGKQKNKDKESESKKADTNQFYIGSSHNTGVVQSPCTSKGFHYNITLDYKLFIDTSKRLLNAQSQLQKTSMLKHNCLRCLALGHYVPKDLLLKDNSKRLPFA